MAKRECGTCTKCCEGHLAGEALGHAFFRGRPCHFLAIGKGCTVYAKRPQEPCVTYKCAWLTDDTLPEWIKPSESNAIIDWRLVDGIKYLNIREAGNVLSSRTLTWAIQYCLKTKSNLFWELEGNSNWYGSPEFVTAIEKSLILQPTLSQEIDSSSQT